MHPSTSVVLARVYFLSGLSALLFQIAWQRLMTVHYGVGPISTALIVSVYMFGLGIGALIGGFLADNTKSPIRAYMLTELALAAFGVASLPLLDLIGTYFAGVDVWLSLLSMCVFLCVPTVLMGMTLPMVTKAFNDGSPQFLRSLSFLYCVNTLGAVVGCLAGSYLIVSFLGLDWAVYIASAIDAGLALTIWLVVRGLPGGSVSPGPTTEAGLNESLGRSLQWVYGVIVLSGFIAIAYEIVWFRLLSVLSKSSPYAYATILSIYLLGIAVGSVWFGKKFAGYDPERRVRGFFQLQAATGICVLVTVAGFFHCISDTDVGRATIQVIFSQQTSAVLSWFCLPLLLMFPATCLMGASFPVLADVILFYAHKEGRAVGLAYFLTTTGNVLGGVCTGFFLLPMLGTELTLLLLALLGISMCVIYQLQSRQRRSMKLLALVSGTILLVLVFPKRTELYLALHKDDFAVPAGVPVQRYFTEGVDGVVFTYTLRLPNSVFAVTRNFINGHAHGFRPGIPYYRETAEALSRADAADDVLVIGLGAGSIVESALLVPSVKQVTLVELSRSVVENISKLSELHDVFSSDRLKVVIDDGRRYLLRSDRHYDLIMIDPLRSTEAYSNNIYSRQFFDLLRSKLKPGGIVMVWLDEFQSIPKTVASVFPHVDVYNYFLLASDRPLTQRSSLGEDLVSRLPAPISSAIRNQETYKIYKIGDRGKILEQCRHSPINEDWRPYSEFFLGRVTRTSASLKSN